MHCRAKLLNYFRQRNRGWVLSLFAAVCIVYLPFLGSPFVFDDLYFFSGNMAGHYTHSLFQLELRWLPYASMSWTTAIFSDVIPHFFRLGNMLLHAANVILLFFLLRQLINAAIPDGEEPATAIWGAWFGALVFACHPVAVYAVGYLIQRSTLMATLFSLVMQLAYLRGLLTGQRRWLALAVGAYFLACFSKEHSVMALALLAAQTILLREGDGEAVGLAERSASLRAYTASVPLGHPAVSPLRGPRTKIPTKKGVLCITWIALFAIALYVILLSRGLFGAAPEPMAANSFGQHGIAESTFMLHGLSVLTQAGLFFKYLLLWWIPNPAWMSVDMREPFISSWLEWQGWLGAIGFIGYGVLGGWLLLRSGWKGLAGLALLYPWLQFMVEFPSIRVQESFVLYRSYLWMPGMMLFFPLLLAKLPSISQNNYKKPFGLSLSKAGSGKVAGGSTSSPRTVAVLTERSTRTLLGLGFIALLLIPLAWNRLWVFADNYRLWNDAALLLRSEREMGADRIFYNRGQAAAAVHKWEDAIADFKRTVALSPQLAPVHHTLGLAYLNSAHYQEALAQFDAAIVLKPEDANFYYAKAMSLKRLHQDDLAMGQMEKSCELKNRMACQIVKMKSGKE